MQEINEKKQKLRQIAINKRKELGFQNEKLSLKIAEFIVSLDEFSASDRVLSYMSLPDEVNTTKIIDRAISSGKKVFIPKCDEPCHNLNFYEYDCSRLIECKYKIKEPDASVCQRLSDFDNSICLVPGLIFDKKGFRIGYGKGYYDRFLKNYNGVSIGICFDNFLLDSIPRDSYDQPVDIIVTDRQIIFP